MHTLVSHIYGFYQLDAESKKRVVEELIRARDQGHDLGWKENRENHVVPVCKYAAGIPLTEEETEVFLAAHSAFENLSDSIILDTCLFFWQVTRDEKYRNKIRKHAIDPISPIYKQAGTLMAYYM